MTNIADWITTFASFPLVKLPEAGTFELEHDSRFDVRDLNRFGKAGGVIITRGYRFYFPAGRYTTPPTVKNL